MQQSEELIICQYHAYQSSWKALQGFIWAVSDIITTSGSQAFTHLIAIVVHGHQAQQMVHVTTFAKFAHQFWLDAFLLQDAFVARRHYKPLHADGTVLEQTARTLFQLGCWADCITLRKQNCSLSVTQGEFLHLLLPRLEPLWSSLCIFAPHHQDFFLNK